jgi:phosphoribosyl-ATP pyrophosphohydrolase
MMDATILDQLFKTIAARKGADPSESYTAKLFSKGRGKIAQKVGEEGVECVIAALSEGPEKLASESADLFYHLLVLWAEVGVKPEDIWTELAKREGISGLDEKAARPKE